LSSNGVKAVIEDLKPGIERAVGHPLSIEFSTATALKAKIEQGDAFDVAILTPALIDDLIAQGKVAADSRTNFARVGVGVGVREGAPTADVSTSAALKRTLLDAKSVAFTAEGQSRPTIDKAFDRLGITSAMKAKTILKGPGEAPTAVATGEADLVLTLISEIRPVPGLQLLGPLPAEVQGYVSFTAGRSPSATDAAAANALLRHLSEPAVSAALRTHGAEPAPEGDPALLTADRSFVEAIAKSDTPAALSLMDQDGTWTDDHGRTLSREQLAKGLPRPAIGRESIAHVRRFEYGRIAVVQADRDRLHVLRVWVKRPEGWRVLVHQEVRSLDAPPTVTPGTGKECENPCRSVPYEPKSVNERAVIAAYLALETSAHSGDALTWGTHVADEFVLVSSNSDRTFDKPTRLAAVGRSSFGGVLPTRLLTGRMFDLGTAVVMTSRHEPDRGNPLQITRVWVNRNGVWQSTLSYQTTIR
jgi:molybdate transport system substrate-binding protein